MKNKKMKVTLVLVVSLFVISALAMAVAGTNEEMEKASAVIQYKVVPVSSPMTQQRLQTVLTTQGNAGWRYVAPFAVGTGPIPSQEVLVFSKP